MKQVITNLKVLCAVCSLFLVFIGQGIAGDMTPDGLSGTVFIGGAYRSGELSLDDASEDDNQLLQSLGQESSDISEFSFVGSVELNYTFAATNTTLGFNMENGPGINVRQYAGDLGYFTAGVFYNEDDVWADPFLTGSARSKTDREILGFSIGWEEIMNTPLSFGYTFESSDIDRDIAGESNALLKRDGQIHRLNISSGLFGNETHELGASLCFDFADLDGDAHSFKGYGIGVFHLFKGGAWELETSASYSLKDFDAIHPAFGEKRDDDLFEIESAFTLFNPFGFENYFVTVFAGYDLVNSNIGFYDAGIFTTGAGVGLTF